MSKKQLLKTYIDKTQKLNKEWSDLVAEMQTVDVVSQRFKEIDNRLNTVITTLASNAVIISDLVLEMGILKNEQLAD